MGRWIGIGACIAGLGIIVGSGPAQGRAAVAAKKHQKSGYKSHGHSHTYQADGQACFDATWSGHGGWTTDYHQTYSSTNNQPGHISDQDSSTYSWDVKLSERGADCALTLLRGFPPKGGAVFDGGFVRYGATQDDVNQPAAEPPVTQKCSKGVITNGGDSEPIGSFTMQHHGADLVFVATVGLGKSPGCGGYFEPGGRVAGGDTHSGFLTARSSPVPLSVFEHAKSVSMTISDNPSNGPEPNCGVPQGQGVVCSQSGAWQGSLTLTVAG